MFPAFFLGMEVSNNAWKSRLAVMCLFLFAFAWLARAEEIKCAVCGQTIHNTFYDFDDSVEGTKKKVCETCAKLPTCFICGMPCGEGSKDLPDGRRICARDLKSVIDSDAEAKQVCMGVKNDLDRLLSRYLTMPDDGSIDLSIVDKFRLQNLFMVPGGKASSCVWVYGATASNPLSGNNKFHHTVDVLSYLQKPRLMAVSAHEFTHTWMNENLSQERRVSLDKNTLEGFCELVAYKYMESLHETAELENIKRNQYTVGQILVLIEADKKYGFNTVMEWFKNGEDTTVRMDDLDRIRAMRDHKVVAPQLAETSGLIYGGPVVATPVPSTLVLKGISGSGTHRFALINNATFETMEKGKVRVGQTTLTVNCLEIGKDYVTIQVEGSTEKKQLFLSTAQ